MKGDEVWEGILETIVEVWKFTDIIKGSIKYRGLMRRNSILGDDCLSAGGFITH